MIRGCALINVLQRTGPYRKAPSVLLQKPSRSRSPLPWRCVAFPKLTFDEIHNKQKRFFRSGNSKSSSSFRSKFFSVFEVLIGIFGGVTAYSIFGQDYSVLSKGKCKEGCTPMKCEDSCLHKMDWAEERIIKANADLQRAITETKSKAADFMEAAKKSHSEAVALMEAYLKYAYITIENDKLESPIYEELWCKIYELSVKRCEKVKEALENRQIAWELLCRLKEIVENGKKCKYTCYNPYLAVEDCVKCAGDELARMMAEMDAIRSEHRLIEELKPDMEKFREQLKGEVHSELCRTDCKCKIRYQEQERALLIHHAYLKAIQIQKKLAKDLVFGKVIVAVKVVPAVAPPVSGSTPELPAAKVEDDEDCWEECECEDGDDE